MERPVHLFPVPSDIEQGITSIPSAQSAYDVLIRQDRGFEVIDLTSRASSYTKDKISEGVDERKFFHFKYY